ncbi:hypothetical protein CDL15_Pgr027029 [Punica granatum]|uniref:Uncharacterized protein n=1 Tax=Punica granatum TaxID=22663 RepID=A0A218W6Y1_PUNGR|nr:hypothetical protein CDL15_Pgr027029 [Punica granatum]PKI47565.1 hypothetical protein CRG98_032040 [Punica granatum]
MRGKSQGNVRESGDSVERLKGCSGAKDARSGKERLAAGPALECIGAGGCSDTRSVARTCMGRQARGTSRTCQVYACMHARGETSGRTGRTGAGTRGDKRASVVTSKRLSGEHVRGQVTPSVWECGHAMGALFTREHDNALK